MERFRLRKLGVVQNCVTQPKVMAALDTHAGSEEGRIPARSVVPHPARSNWQCVALRDHVSQLIKWQRLRRGRARGVRVEKRDVAASRVRRPADDDHHDGA